MQASKRLLLGSTQFLFLYFIVDATSASISTVAIQCGRYKKFNQYCQFVVVYFNHYRIIWYERQVSFVVTEDLAISNMCIYDNTVKLKVEVH